MRLTNDIKLKLDALFSKTGIDIELIEKESNWDGVYYYKLKPYPISVYVETNYSVKFSEKFWYELNKIIQSFNMKVYCNEKKNMFVVTNRKKLNIGTYKGGMSFYVGVSDDESYVFVEEDEQSVLVLNDLGAVSKLQKEKFRVFDTIAL